MKLSVIFDDNRIVKDGVGYAVTLPHKPEIWAIQWDGEVGHIEYRDATTLNEAINDADIIAPYVEIWDAANAEIEQSATANLVTETIKAELARSDLVALRCYKAGVEFPADWQAWDKQLRAALNSPALYDPNIKPPYPANT